jgi:uncharacterized protein YkwD
MKLCFFFVALSFLLWAGRVSAQKRKPAPKPRKPTALKPVAPQSPTLPPQPAPTPDKPPAKPAAETPAEPLDEWELAFLQEINEYRAAPEKAVAMLQDYRKLFRGMDVFLPGMVTLMTNEGVSAVDDAIRFIREVRPLPPLQPSPGLKAAARDHLLDISLHNLASHIGSNGSLPSMRISRRGVVANNVAENISYFTKEPRAAVLAMLIDDGNPTRGHRKNLFSPTFNFIGLAHGDSREWGHICVLNLADKTTP